MSIFLKLLSSIAAAVLGYFCMIFIGFMADYLDYIPAVVSLEQSRKFYFYLFGVGLMFWTLFAIASLSFIFMSSNNRFRYWFLGAPVYGSVIYAVITIIWFAI